jgi:hypothetical protein
VGLPSFSSSKSPVASFLLAGRATIPIRFHPLPLFFPRHGAVAHPRSGEHAGKAPALAEKRPISRGGRAPARGGSPDTGGLLILSLAATCKTLNLFLVLEYYKLQWGLMARAMFDVARAPQCETWVPMGPHRPGSRRSLSSGPNLPESPPTCKWAQRPYPQSWRPWKTSDDLIQTPEDLPGLQRKPLPRSWYDAASRSEDCGI